MGPGSATGAAERPTCPNGVPRVRPLTAMPAPTAPPLQSHLEAMLGPGATFRDGQREAIAPWLAAIWRCHYEPLA